VLEGARNIVKWKKELKSRTPFVIFQFLVVRHNEHQVADVKALAKEIGVDDVWLKTAQVYDYENDPNNLIPKNDRWSRYRRNTDGKMEFKGNNANHCWRLWHDPVITWDGAVVPCCFDKDAQHQLGHLKGQSFAEIWRSGVYQQFRNQVLQSRSNIDICANCSEGVKVWEKS
jgi:radical SAM protein with 4Fe4S-binding SPASM domain